MGRKKSGPTGIEYVKDYPLASFKGLLQETIVINKSTSRYAGHWIAVDASHLLYRALYPCAVELARCQLHSGTTQRPLFPTS